ncbi:MAG: acyl-CoA dehydrogenase family protein [Actinomycetota bacterium]|nr:acyl-CoA dehydrogenase family protein [Actinomycetota bacterium]
MQDHQNDQMGALVESVHGHASAIESAGRLPDEVLTALRASGVFGMWVPRELGGAESTPADVIDAIELLSAADGSTGWCAAVAVGTGAVAAYLPEAGAREIFSTPSTITGGSFNPAGRAIVVDGGLRVSGRWAFGSGSQHADWLCGTCLVLDEKGQPVIDDGGRPDARLVFFPTVDATIIDTWHVVGLEGTGSHDFEVTDIEVPFPRAMSLAFDPWPTGALWRLPPMALFFSPMAAVPLGIARAAIDELVRLAQEKTPYRSAQSLAERDVVQSMVARAEALVRSAGAFLREALDEVHAAAERGQDISLHQRALVRLAVVNGSRSGTKAVDLCFEAAGSSALFRANPMQRYFRDVHVAGQHVVLAFSGLETVGRVLLGLEPDTPLL